MTIANGARLRLTAGTTIANALSLAGSTLELKSPEALDTVAALIAGTAAAPASLTPTVSWSPQVADTTFSDVLDLTNTAGTVQILELSYDPSILGGLSVSDLILGWDDNGDWINAIAGNSGAAGGSAVVDQTGSVASLGILATSDYLGSWGCDTTTNTVWAVIDHNSSFAAVAVPEPGTLALAGLAAATLGLGCGRRRWWARPEVVARFTINAIPAMALLSRVPRAKSDDPTVTMWEFLNADRWIIPARPGARDGPGRLSMPALSSAALGRRAGL